MYPQSYPQHPQSRRLSSELAAYTVQERRPGARYSIPPCVKCAGTVEKWAAPLDSRVPPLCDACQHEKPE